MAHKTLKSGYESLVDRINLHPQGAPPSELLNQILKLLFSEKEANLVSCLPLKPFTVSHAARRWRMNEKQARKQLDNLADRAILLDVEYNEQSYYVLPPPMAGFFEFSMMRVRNDIDQKRLAELYYQYLNVEEDFVRQLFTTGKTQLGRVFVNEQAIMDHNAATILDFEKASEIIKSSKVIGLGSCYCRHKMHHVGKACDAPMEICMTFGNVAGSLIKSGYAKEIETSHCLDLLTKANEHNLVQFGENAQRDVAFICNCCGCCCEAMLASKRFALLNPVHTSSYIPKVASDSCVGCGKCEKACPVEVIQVDSRSRKARIDEHICLGCGVCSRVCPTNAILMKTREGRVITPVDSAHRTVLQAIERGKLQHLIFDNHLLLSHRAMAAILGVILKLPPIKQLLASKQLQSRFLNILIDRFENSMSKPCPD